jgi:hypothetical protein
MQIPIRDPESFDPESGMEKLGSGLRDKHPESATLLKIF